MFSFSYPDIFPQFMGEQEEDPVLKIRDKVSDWLTAGKWDVTKEPRKGMRFVLKAVRESHPPLIVAQHADSPDHFVLRYEIRIPPEQRDQLRLSGDDVLKQLNWDLVTQLAPLVVQYAVVKQPVPELIALMVPIYYDGLTKDTFFQRLLRLRSAYFVAQSCLLMALGLPLIEDGDEEIN